MLSTGLGHETETRSSAEVAVGWVGVLAAPQMFSGIGIPGAVLVMVGGALYTVGAVIYAAKWPNPFPHTLGFHEIFGEAGATAPLTIAGEATFEAAQNAAVPLPTMSRDSRRVGVETRIGGLMPDFVAADHTLTFRVERTAGARPERASLFAYDQSWTLGSLTRVGFNMRLQRRAGFEIDHVEPSIHLNWRTQL